MKSQSPRWNEITPSEFPWEREALAYVRDKLPDHEPYRAWSNFTFIADDGSLNEVDLLVLSPQGLFLVEIKSRPGVVRGDAGTWTYESEGRFPRVDDNPIKLTDRKAKKLKSLLQRQKAAQKIRLPWMSAAVFLSATDLTCKLSNEGCTSVFMRDGTPPEQLGHAGEVMAYLTGENLPQSHRGPRIDRIVAKAISRAMDDAGIRPSQAYRRVADYNLLEVLHEGPTYQDWLAEHVTLKDVRHRIRIYPFALDDDDETRAIKSRAAQREYQVIHGIEHPGILRPPQFTDQDHGPCLVFEQDPSAMRLDHFLARHGDRLDVSQRLDLLRQIAEAIGYAHERKLVHRALSPESVLIRDPLSKTPRAQIHNWQAAGRNLGHSKTVSIAVSATNHLDHLLEDTARVYLAPETFAHSEEMVEQRDVFSLGAIAYRLLSNKIPAVGFHALCERLKRDQGLRISGEVDGAPEELDNLIRYATHPEVTQRTDTVTEFLDQLSEAEHKLSGPNEPEYVEEPTKATAGDFLQGGLQVIKRLGTGSTAVVFLVKALDAKDDTPDRVLKLALTPQHNDRLRDEKEVLEKLRHQYIVEVYDLVDVGDRVGILMAPAGEETLGERLRSEGRLVLDLLQRFGEDLLQAVEGLEEEGIPHRDLKPDNIGIVPRGKNHVLHLVLFDFSLSRQSVEHIEAGTIPYLDPFLKLLPDKRWNLHAERFAAAMTLHEMATGTLPRWGDGKSDPAVLNVEVSIEPELFEPSLRDGLKSFFEKALARDQDVRFDNAAEMLQEWRKIFAAAEVPAPDGEATLKLSEDALAKATLETPLRLLGLSSRAVNAVERLEAFQVSDLLGIKLASVTMMKGVGNKTRREILESINQLASRFPDFTPEPVAPTDDPAITLHPEVTSVDLLAKQILAIGAQGQAQKATAALEELLGLTDAAADAPMGWCGQAEIATALNLTRGRISQYLGKARSKWGKNISLTALRDQVADFLQQDGGVMTAHELAETVLAARGSTEQEPLRTRQALAVVRAATETERFAEKPRWIVRRSRERVLLASEDPDGQQLADYAERLGARADELAEQDPLLPPDRVRKQLLAVRRPDGAPAISEARLVRLAASASESAALSVRGELYPRGMDAERTLRLAYGALFGPNELSVDVLHGRISARYPEAQPLPERPELDQMLQNAGWSGSWNATAANGRGAYIPTGITSTVSTGSTGIDRLATRLGTAPPPPDSPEFANARQFEQRLAHAAKAGAFLALSVHPRFLPDAEREITSGRFAIDFQSIEARLINTMKTVAQAKNVSWDVVINADAADKDSQDGRNLQFLVTEAVKRLTEELGTNDKTLVLTRPGMLARYGKLDLISQLRERVGQRTGSDAPDLHGLWVLVPTPDYQSMPTVDGQAIPVITPGEWARIPRDWLENHHRAAAAGGAP